MDYKNIDKILWEGWDPLGVNEYEEARDEYTSYAKEIAKKIENGSTEKDICDYLIFVQSDYMLLGGNVDEVCKSCVRIAQQIFLEVNKSW